MYTYAHLLGKEKMVRMKMEKKKNNKSPCLASVAEEIATQKGTVVGQP